jgi:3'-phosphoadenosine 5'-phosphosulfate sulfotransferase (PAPS reductase)/FAD synthetase
LDKYGYPLPSKEAAQHIYRIKNYNPESKIVRRAKGLIEGERGLAKKWHFLLDAPFAVSHKCCDALKKLPFSAYHYKHHEYPFMGMMAEESWVRKTDWLRRGCNIFDSKRPSSRPIMFWTEKDIHEYVAKYNITLAPPYDMGYDRTGCIFCMFGYFQEEPGNTRFDKLKRTHPQLHKYCMEKLGLRDILNWTNEQLGRPQLSDTDIDYEELPWDNEVAGEGQLELDFGGGSDDDEPKDV